MVTDQKDVEVLERAISNINRMGRGLLGRGLQSNVSLEALQSLADSLQSLLPVRQIEKSEPQMRSASLGTHLADVDKQRRRMGVDY